MFAACEVSQCVYSILSDAFMVFSLPFLCIAFISHGVFVAALLLSFVHRNGIGFVSWVNDRRHLDFRVYLSMLHDDCLLSLLLSSSMLVDVVMPNVLKISRGRVCTATVRIERALFSDLFSCVAFQCIPVHR